MRLRLAASLGAILVVGACVWYVVAPPKGADGYRERAASTLQTLHSQVQSARIWVETERDGEATPPATLVGLREAEQDADSAAATFEAYEPPSGLVGLRSEVSSLATSTVEALAALRIAAEQGRWSDLPRLAAPLRDLAPRLADLRERADG